MPSGGDSSVGAEMHQQQIGFADSAVGESVNFDAPPLDSFDSCVIKDLSLGDYLSRPVLIDTFNWLEAAFFQHNFDPWALFFAHGPIAKKLDNYGLIRCTLKLKIVVSASPFYYGAGLVSYVAKPDFHLGTNVVIAGDEQIVTYSQRPHAWIYPSESQGAELQLPFFHEYNWMNVDADVFSGMGTIIYSSPTTLKNANSVAGANVTVRCYAWAENVELSAPTLQLQGKRTSKAKFGKKKKGGKKPTVMSKVSDFSNGREDEYDGAVSSIASAVANASSALTNVPIIGPMARATEIGAGALSRVAAWFGYTNVPIISDVLPYKNTAFGGFASSEISAPTPKLTLDPKNELTLDPRTVGLDGTDELALEHYLSKETYLTDFVWDTSDPSNSFLFGMAMNPSGFYRRNGSTVWPSPLSHTSQLYKYWTGSIIVKFRVICTPYHRGRFKIMFEPSQGVAFTTTLDETANITRIFDLGETNEVEICVPYMQAEAFLENYRFTGSTDTSFSTVAASISPLADYNGFITVNVVNELTSPVADAPVEFIVSVRAGDDFKYVGPQAPPNTLAWALQSDVVPLMDCLGDTEQEEPEVFQVYGGESAMSLRQLLHRHCYVRSAADDEAAGYYKSTFGLYPTALAMAASSKNVHDAGGGIRRSYCANTFENWIAPTFAGRRGSMYWAVNFVDNDVSNVGAFFRASSTVVAPTAFDAHFALPWTSPTDTSYKMLLTGGPLVDTGNGAAMYATSTQAGLTTLVPFISNLRFMGTYPNSLASASTRRLGVDENAVTFVVSLIRSGTDKYQMSYYCATGPDYNLFFFMGVPSMTSTSITPPT